MNARAATVADLPVIRGLLEAADLTVAEADEAFEHGVVIEDAGSVVAAAAVEPYGPAGLLRSVVVDAERRGEGLGQRVVAAAESLAWESGIGELFLLTETAAAWFPRLGYEVVPRDRVPLAVRRSVEFTSACPTTALAMRRRLDDRGVDAGSRPSDT
jgi:amino-acid N-acetyltransferase